MINMSKVEKLLQMISTYKHKCWVCPLDGTMLCPIQYDEWTSSERCQKALMDWISTLDN